MDAIALARSALRAGYECVVAVGGDGTLNEVANGFFESGRLVREGSALGVIPCGTGGDFRRAFRWTTDLADAAARLKGEGTRPLDVGLLRFVGPGGERAERYFVNVASAGVSGQVDFEVNRASKILGGRASFAIGTLKAMIRYHNRRVRFSLDDGPAREAETTVFAVANGQYFGGGIWVAPDARSDDGLFDLTLWSSYRLRDLALHARSLYDGSHVRLSNTSRFQAKKVRLESDEEVLLDIDGEQPGKLPASMEILPGALRLKV
jgi:YegS/Rv2252/BmrU family lipid kinase